MELYDRKNVSSELNPIDLSQIVSTAKNQDIISNQSKENALFWMRCCDLLIEVISRDMDRVNLKTFVVIISSTYFEIQRCKPEVCKKLWSLMDKQLISQFSDLMKDMRSSFIVARANTQHRSLTELSAGIRESIL